jgi:hypothetical protein|eukprot:COSAG06_NODE_33_length_31080_cov_10.329428_8_plen_83_part_00
MQGDYNFSSQTGRALGSIYATVAVLVTSNFIGGVSGYIVFVEQEKIIQRKLKRELTPDDVVAMDEDGYVLYQRYCPQLTSYR